LRHLISLKDWTPEEIKEILENAIKIKKNPEKYFDTLKGKTLIMLFEKTSTRTRLSFETAMTQLGGHAIFLDKRTTQFMIAEFIDEIKATMRFGDILMYRPIKSEDVEKAAELNQIPVINGLCKKYHPCQALGDAFTMIENCSGTVDSLKGKKVVYIGIGNNISNSLALVTTKLGGKFVLCVPEKDQSSVDKELLKQVKDSGLYEETTDIDCVKDADFIHTDTWMNMEFFEDGKVKEESKTEYETRKKKLVPFQLNTKLIDDNCPKAKIMHCMPCHIGYEITRDAIDHKNSVIFDQAENRVHAQKAIILELLNKTV